MNKLLLLLKNYGKMYISAFTKKQNRAKNLSGGAILIFAGIVFLVLFTTMSITQIEEAIKIGMPEVAMYSFVAIGIIFSLLIVILKATNSKKMKDTDLLLSLPISRITIILAKILREYIFDVLMLSLIMMPSFICYYIMTKNTSISVIILGLLLVLLLSLLSNALSVFIKIIIFNLTKKFRHAEIIQTIINVIIMISFIGAYLFFNTALTDLNSGFAEKIFEFYPIKMIVEILLHANIVNLIILCIICVIPFSLAIYFSVIDLNKQHKKVKNCIKEIKYQKNHIVKSLFKKELATYFRSTSYVVNTIIGGILLVCFALIILIVGPDYIFNALGQIENNKIISLIVNNINCILILLLTLLSGMIVTTSASISLEGKTFWILKAHPINVSDVFHAKLFLNLIIGGIPCLISGLIISFVIGPKYLAFSILLPLLNLSFSAINGLIINIKYPKLDWQSEEEVIKRGMAVLITMVTSIIPSIILIALYFGIFIKFIPTYLFLSFAIIVMVVINIIRYYQLMNNGKILFNKIID